MKHAILPLLALLALTGCVTKTAPVTALTPCGVYYDGIYALEYNGHEYLWNSQGGIIHSESCPCWDAYTTDETEYE